VTLVVVVVVTDATVEKVVTVMMVDRVVAEELTVDKTSSSCRRII
jgi:hypothetical protein